MAAVALIAGPRGTVGYAVPPSDGQGLVVTTETASQTDSNRREATRSLPPTDPESGDAPSFPAGTSGVVEALDAAVQESTPASRSSALDEALAALKPLIVRTDATESEWLHAARLLRVAAIERRFSSPRVASTALLLSDALSFTEVETVGVVGRAPLKRGLTLLMQAFVSTDDERGLLRELLEHRWYVTPGFDAEAFAAVAAR